MPSKIIAGNNQDSIAVDGDASVCKKVCSHILALRGENDQFWGIFAEYFMVLCLKKLVTDDKLEIPTLASCK
ncbi:MULTISPECIES: hypothetical protein [unclassified Microcoleus]|uniref:hypothetical protein n=1 Tax=unclassified Microcoleus TaxID=2642155 RepID=UPI002FD49228